LFYPNSEENHATEARLVAVLETVGLSALAGGLATVDNWSQRLSLGEQQRLAFARVLLARPPLLFLDEATSAVDEPSEARLYGLLRTVPWQPTIISVGHRSTLRRFHEHVLDIGVFTLLPARSTTGHFSGCEIAH
jgi:putative ATP-binding cassette transporter